jgi:hypothetical protein
VRLALPPAFCLILTLSSAAQDLALEKQAAVGKMADAVLRATPPVKSQEVQDYVARLGTGSAALPRGYIFVPVSELLRAKDETEFARGLARAMARGPYTFRTGLGVTGYWTGPLLPMALRREQNTELDRRAGEAADTAVSEASPDRDGSADFKRIQNLARR